MDTLVKITGSIVATAFIFVAFFALIRFFSCGSDRAVVRVVSPVAKIISDDILKSEIPKSLKDIKGLPYELEGCRRSEVYEDRDDRIVSKEKAYLKVIEEKCIFKKKNKVYNVDIWYVQNFIYHGRSHGHLRLFNQETSTGIKYHFDYSKDRNKLKLATKSRNNPYIFDYKSTGFCELFRHYDALLPCKQKEDSLSYSCDNDVVWCTESI